ncbi:hypothetical protein BESB_044010 [Besnoitia besnoiti]|uniref:Uncharacterized protein n=1 Tax=Besnoitia besnoiti TaxID=94643 RepID=A0A2A9MEA6_BESBE|nr:hypothetical protein BESB_044010 [Besnoitia besnoiti]PFH36209.1 hypothetical protein BESB_044010 [Besnoitia besnoiti]
MHRTSQPRRFACRSSASSAASLMPALCAAPSVAGFPLDGPGTRPAFPPSSRVMPEGVEVDAGERKEKDGMAVARRKSPRHSEASGSTTATPRQGFPLSSGVRPSPRPGSLLRRASFSDAEEEGREAGGSTASSRETLPRSQCAEDVWLSMARFAGACVPPAPADSVWRGPAAPPLGDGADAEGGENRCALPRAPSSLSLSSADATVSPFEPEAAFARLATPARRSQSASSWGGGRSFTRRHFPPSNSIVLMASPGSSLSTSLAEETSRETCDDGPRREAAPVKTQALNPTASPPWGGPDVSSSCGSPRYAAFPSASRSSSSASSSFLAPSVYSEEAASPASAPLRKLRVASGRSASVLHRASSLADGPLSCGRLEDVAMRSDAGSLSRAAAHLVGAQRDQLRRPQGLASESTRSFEAPQFDGGRRVLSSASRVSSKVSASSVGVLSTRKPGSLVCLGGGLVGIFQGDTSPGILSCSSFSSSSHSPLSSSSTSSPLASPCHALQTSSSSASSAASQAGFSRSAAARPSSQAPRASTEALRVALSRASFRNQGGATAALSLSLSPGAVSPASSSLSSPRSCASRRGRRRHQESFGALPPLVADRLTGTASSLASSRLSSFSRCSSVVLLPRVEDSARAVFSSSRVHAAVRPGDAGDDDDAFALVLPPSPATLRALEEKEKETRGEASELEAPRGKTERSGFFKRKTKTKDGADNSPSSSRHDANAPAAGPYDEEEAAVPRRGLLRNLVSRRRVDKSRSLSEAAAAQPSHAAAETSPPAIAAKGEPEMFRSLPSSSPARGRSDAPPREAQEPGRAEGGEATSYGNPFEEGSLADESGDVAAPPRPSAASPGLSELTPVGLPPRAREMGAIKPALKRTERSEGGASRPRAISFGLPAGRGASAAEDDEEDFTQGGDARGAGAASASADRRRSTRQPPNDGGGGRRRRGSGRAQRILRRGGNMHGAQSATTGARGAGRAGGRTRAMSVFTVEGDDDGGAERARMSSFCSEPRQETRLTGRAPRPLGERWDSRDPFHGAARVRDGEPLQLEDIPTSPSYLFTQASTLQQRLELPPAEFFNLKVDVQRQRSVFPRRWVAETMLVHQSLLLFCRSLRPLCVRVMIPLSNIQAVTGLDVNLREKERRKAAKRGWRLKVSHTERIDRGAGKVFDVIFRVAEEKQMLAWVDRLTLYANKWRLRPSVPELLYRPPCQEQLAEVSEDVQRAALTLLTQRLFFALRAATLSHFRLFFFNARLVALAKRGKEREVKIQSEALAACDAAREREGARRLQGVLERKLRQAFADLRQQSERIHLHTQQTKRFSAAVALLEREEEAVAAHITQWRRKALASPLSAALARRMHWAFSQLALSAKLGRAKEKQKRAGAAFLEDVLRRCRDARLRAALLSLEKQKLRRAAQEKRLTQLVEKMTRHNLALAWRQLMLVAFQATKRAESRAIKAKGLVLETFLLAAEKRRMIDAFFRLREHTHAARHEEGATFENMQQVNTALQAAYARIPRQRGALVLAALARKAQTSRLSSAFAQWRGRVRREGQCAQALRNIQRTLQRKELRMKQAGFFALLRRGCLAGERDCQKRAAARLLCASVFLPSRRAAGGAWRRLVSHTSEGKFERELKALFILEKLRRRRLQGFFTQLQREVACGRDLRVFLRTHVLQAFVHVLSMHRVKLLSLAFQRLRTVCGFAELRLRPGFSSDSRWCLADESFTEKALFDPFLPPLAAGEAAVSSLEAPVFAPHGVDLPLHGAAAGRPLDAGRAGSSHLLHSASLPLPTKQPLSASLASSSSTPRGASASLSPAARDARATDWMPGPAELATEKLRELLQLSVELLSHQKRLFSSPVDSQLSQPRSPAVVTRNSALRAEGAVDWLCERLEREDARAARAWRGDETTWEGGDACEEPERAARGAGAARLSGECMQPLAEGSCASPVSFLLPRGVADERGDQVRGHEPFSSFITGSLRAASSAASPVSFAAGKDAVLPPQARVPPADDTLLFSWHANRFAAPANELSLSSAQGVDTSAPVGGRGGTFVAGDFVAPSPTHDARLFERGSPASRVAAPAGILIFEDSAEEILARCEKERRVAARIEALAAEDRFYAQEREVDALIHTLDGQRLLARAPLAPARLSAMEAVRPSAFSATPPGSLSPSHFGGYRAFADTAGALVGGEGLRDCKPSEMEKCERRTRLCGAVLDPLCFCCPSAAAPREKEQALQTSPSAASHVYATASGVTRASPSLSASRVHCSESSQEGTGSDAPSICELPIDAAAASASFATTRKARLLPAPGSLPESLAPPRGQAMGKTRERELSRGGVGGVPALREKREGEEEEQGGGRELKEAHLERRGEGRVWKYKDEEEAS